jgi:MoxR-like ATPase
MPTSPSTESTALTSTQIADLEREVEQRSLPFRRLQEQMHRVIVGQQELLDGLVIGLLANGHILIEGVPGLAKTTAVACLADGIHTEFQRIQFTPDLLPADLVGTLVYRPGEGDFTVKKGPIFSNIVLADEINRAPAKVQSALLEAMQERQVTIGSETFALPQPFLVLATQNPVEQEGTYPLPEAQVDRFMLKLVVRYPDAGEERTILDRMARTGRGERVEPVMDPTAIADARELVDRIFIDDRIKDYIVALVVATRDPRSAGVPLEGLLEFGASPRATISLAIAAKAKAFLEGRGYVVPQDVKDVAPDVLRHRLILSYEAEAEEKGADDLVRTLLDHVAVP